MNFSHFISHLEELRTRIIVTLLVFGVTMIGGFVFSDPIIHWLVQPLEKVLPEGLVFFKPHEAFLIHAQAAMMAGAVAAIPVLIVQGLIFILCIR